MTKLSTIILAVLSIFIISCDKDNNENRPAIPENPKTGLELTQTYWEGKYLDTANGITTEYDVRITFKNEDDEDSYRSSSYTILNIDSEEEYSSGMFYKTNGKVLSINDSGRELDGDWWKISGDNNQLILQRNLESTISTSKLIISRKKI